MTGSTVEVPVFFARLPIKSHGVLKVDFYHKTEHICESNTSGEQGEVVIYAYAAGTYSASEAEGEENDLFLNAVSSTRLSSAGDYQLSFLEAGSYELVAVSYQYDDNDGQVELAGRFRLEALLGLNLAGLNVEAESNTSANFTLTALIP